MALNTYLLHQESIINSIHRFFVENPCGAYTINEVKDEKEYHVRLSEKEENLNKKKAFGILKLYFSKGRTSFDVQGNSKFSDNLTKCKDFIVESTELSSLQKENRCAVFRDITDTLYKDFIDYLSSESDLEVNSFGTDSKVNDRIDIKGRYDTHLTVTYYKTGTLMIQGLITTLLIKVFNIAVSIFGAEDTSDNGGFLEAIKIPGVEILSESLEDHFPDRSKFVDTPYESMILTSIKLLNSNVVVPDYSTMSFGALKVLEGIIGMRLEEDETFKKKESIGSRFLPDETGVGQWKLTTHKLISAPLIKALEDAYSFYHAERNTTFHVKIQDPMTSFIYPDKSQALGVVEETIRLINRIIHNW